MAQKPSHRRPPARRRRPAPRQYFWETIDWNALLRRPEFREDSLGSTFLQKLFLTRQQRLSLLRWGSYILSCLVCLILQDSIFSRFHILGASTDLPAMMILMITVIEGTETGSIFVLLASTLYYFTGSSPGPYVVAAMTILGVGAAFFRQLYWHRSQGSMTLCACLALMLYEISVFVISLFQGLTHWGRAPRFLTAGAISCIFLALLFPLIHKFGKIGGHTWKE